jgi:DNA-binding NtrC family response regulator
MADLASSGFGNRRILIVEDDYVIAMELAEALEERGAVVFGPVGSVHEAEELLRSEDGLDAAILDINLGRENAFPVADRLMSRKVPFLFTTGYDDWVMPQPYVAVPRLEKPTDLHALMQALGRILEPRQRART